MYMCACACALIVYCSSSSSCYTCRVDKVLWHWHLDAIQRLKSLSLALTILAQDDDELVLLLLVLVLLLFFQVCSGGTCCVHGHNHNRNGLASAGRSLFLLQLCDVCPAGGGGAMHHYFAFAAGGTHNIFISCEFSDWSTTSLIFAVIPSFVVLLFGWIIFPRVIFTSFFFPLPHTVLWCSQCNGSNSSSIF